MNKLEMTKAVATKLNVTQHKAADIIEAVMNTFFEGVAADGKAVFGQWKFWKKISEARKCRNPRTGESIDVPRKTKVAFKITGV